ncbi:MAG TPA: ATP-dependent DNA helicase [Microlunatus sp.]|nr:ATP-dependent DNA helicase [Microlunatus sp.]
MSVVRLPVKDRSGSVFDTPEDLCAALQIPFSEQQLAAITAPLEPGVIIAGAGSGKTTVMAARVVWLVGIGEVRPEEVLGLTFTRKAAAELSQRVRSALERAGVVPADGVDAGGEQLVMTYDAFAARLVAEHGLRLGYETDPVMITGATRYRLASRVVREAAGPFEHISRLRPATVTERVLRLDADLQQHLVAVPDLDPHAHAHLLELASAPLNRNGNVYADLKKAAAAAHERLELASLVVAYQQLKQRLGVVEFADQMAIAARLAQEVPAVSELVRSAYRVVLLDEFQDTSAAQAQMLRGLFSGRTPSEGMGHPVTAVGDPFQAIYGWRGAAASNITSFADQFRTARGRPAAPFALTVNRRSGQTILDVANTLSRPLRADAGALVSGVGEAPAGMGFLVAPEGTPPGVVRAATFETWPAEVSWVADQVIAARADGTAPHWAGIAVLTRRNADIAPFYAELTARDVPVEIVGLGGLLTLPEVMDVTATLRVLDDVTANPDMIRLLTGPRWRIGPRDLALLGRRARELAQVEGGPAPDLPDVLTELEGAVADVDPTEVVSLLDAVESPGDLPYSAAALDRFALLAAELAGLRRHTSEPVLDLCRRVVATLGLEVELMATPELDRTNRRDQLGAFYDAVAGYVDVDGDASLAGLLAYLQAEIDTGAGLEQAVPSDREAVKLLTVHKAKGLEWDVVFLPALMKGVFPSDRVTDNWLTNPGVLPADLRGDAGSIPQLAETSNAAVQAYKEALKQQQLLAEDRLAYVAVTRARRLLVGTGHTWRIDGVRPRVRSTYLEAVLAEADRQDQLVVEAPPPAEANPLVTAAVPVPWPAPYDPEAWRRRTEAGVAVQAARRRRRETGSYELSSGAGELLLDGLETTARWDADLERLLAEVAAARAERSVVTLPDSMSASNVLRLEHDPQGLAADLARPMPRPPSRAARFGTRFHQWVERYFGAAIGTGQLGQQQLLDPDDLPDRADLETPDETGLRELCATFLAGRYGNRVPYAVEAPFTLLVDGTLVRGRIDAVYDLRSGRADPATDGGYDFQVVDWKTGRAETADPLQLAIYRQAWAEVCQLPPERVDAVFYLVATDTVVRPEALPGRADIAGLLAGGGTIGRRIGLD